MNFDCTSRKVCYDCAEIRVVDYFNMTLSDVDDFAHFNASDDCW